MDVTKEATIRPTDSFIHTLTTTYMHIDSAQAIRRIMDLAFRDCWTVLDTTYGKGNFWVYGLPDYIELSKNDLFVKDKNITNWDFTYLPYKDGLYDLVVFDPPHLADGGVDGMMTELYTSVKGINSLIDVIERGVQEAWRVSEKGIIVKVIDSAHGGKYVMLSDVVKSALNMNPYFVLHTIRPAPVIDPKHEAVRVPRNNGAQYLVFRREKTHIDFDKLYSKQFR